MRTLFLTIILLSLFFLACEKKESPYIFHEEDVPTYTLPDPLIAVGGSAIQTAEQWEEQRTHLQELFASEVYGHVPGELDSMRVEELSNEPNALAGKAIRKEWQLHFWRNGLHAEVVMLVFFPKHQAVSPIFLGMNFSGNHAIHPDPTIRVNGNKPDSLRGTRSSRWPVERMIERGYGLATLRYGDVVPDISEAFDKGVYPLFYEQGQTRPDSTEWGAIGVWAWTLSRALDALEQDSLVDVEKVAVIGHSRLGKTALWAGAQDTRFSMVVSNNSGCGGAALSRRTFGETVAEINRVFPHWFNDRFPLYDFKEETLPVDQHMLISLIAPRPVYVASASEDLWADPRGEFLSAYHASSVYELLGGQGLFQEEMPEPDQPLVEGMIGYHLRTGKHDQTLYDWEQYLDFADKWMR